MVIHFPNAGDRQWLVVERAVRVAQHALHELSLRFMCQMLGLEIELWTARGGAQPPDQDTENIDDRR